MHVFWGKKKDVQLKIVQHEVSVMLYSVQAFKIRASQGQCFIIEGSCISNTFEMHEFVYLIAFVMHEFMGLQPLDGRIFRKHEFVEKK